MTPEPNPNQKIEQMTWWDKVNLIRALSLFPAITVMVFTRRRLGFRLMKPTWLVILTVIMLLVSLLAPRDFVQPFGFLMPLYALAMLGLGLFQRWQRWKELCGGGRWHTLSPGISYLEQLSLPRFFASHRRVNRFLDPLAIAIIGMLVVFLSHGLGLWIVFSAFFLYVFEQDLYEKQLNRDLDTLDGLIAAEVQGETVQFFEGKLPDQQPRSLEETAGIPTGLAEDIAKQVELRRAKMTRASNNPAQAS